MTFKTLALAIVLLGLVTEDAAAQRQPATGTASLSGRVIDAREQPLRGVTLRLLDYDRRSEATATTDATGRYSFTEIAAGNYHVLARHRGYVAQVHGVPDLTTAAFPTPEGLISIGPGGRVTGINFQLIKGATIRGRVTTPEGLPVAGATVTSVFVVGSNQVRYTPSAAMAWATTSKTGEFVLEGLGAGLYFVAATPPTPKHTSATAPAAEFQRTFYPGAPQTDALAIRVAIEDAVSGIDFPLLRSDLVTVSGAVIGTESEGPIEGFIVSGGSTRNLVVRADGTFSAPGLKPGRYTVWVRAKTAYGFEAAWETVEAFADVPFLQLAMTTTATISGRVVTVDGTPLPVEGFRVAAAWTADGKDVDPMSRDQAEVAADGAFEIDGVFADRTMRIIGLPAGWQIDRIVTAGKREANPLRLRSGERVEVTIVIAR